MRAVSSNMGHLSQTLEYYIPSSQLYAHLRKTVLKFTQCI